VNPEFRRNLWLELTTRRVATMTLVLALIFFAAALSGTASLPESVAVWLFYFIVVFWGTRNSALSVVGEIRDRTWDMQRLSAIAAGPMAFGKLFGSTIFNWYGGAICLGVIAVFRFVHDGAATAVLNIIFFLLIGVIAQSVALLASLVAALRRQAHSRLEVFGYQATGLVAAILAFDVWDTADPAGAFLPHARPVDHLTWWGVVFDARVFLLVSLALFACWTLVGCYRAMRRELKMNNGPFVWLGFLLFIGIYVAGFDAWTSQGLSGVVDIVGRRLAITALTYAVITYAMVLLEPKDRVLYRRLGADLAQGRPARALLSLQAWMLSYAFATVAAGGLVARLWQDQMIAPVGIVLAALGFMTRDVAIFVLLQSLPGQRRGDFAALVMLFALYVLAPSILHGLDLKQAQILFFPHETQPFWLSPAVSWAEAAIMAGFAIARLSTAAGREPGSVRAERIS
jgi:hypothetical protein